MFQKRWTFGFGTIFSLIAVYFIHLYSKEKDWVLLAFISKWYLIIVGGLIALTFGLVLLILAFSLIIFLAAMLKLHSRDKKHRKQKSKDYVDVEYKVKE